jgi:hypothetical protein
MKVNEEIRCQSIPLITKYEHQRNKTVWFLRCLINCLLKHVIERKKGRKDKEEDVSSYLLNLKKREDTGSARCHFVEIALRKRYWTCRKAT